MVRGSGDIKQVNHGGRSRWGEGLHRAEINGLVHLLSWGGLEGWGRGGVVFIATEEAPGSQPC